MADATGVVIEIGIMYVASDVVIFELVMSVGKAGSARMSVREAGTG